MKDDELLHKWINGELTADELEAFKRRPEYPSLLALQKNTETLSAPDFDEDVMLSEILKTPKSEKEIATKVRKLSITGWVKYGIAASLLLLAGWVFLFRPAPEVHINLAKAERQEGQLPDGSTFVLNAESHLSYAAANWDAHRKLQLDGEAFFEVKKGNQFDVVTTNGTVRVLGTKFNVRSRKEGLEVKCQSGKVGVLTNAGEQIGELEQGDALRFKDGELIEKWEFDPEGKVDWVEGISKFRKVALSVVLEELERQFNVEINAGKLNTNEIVSCNFQHKDLELALKTTLVLSEVKYRIEGKKIYLY